MDINIKVFLFLLFVSFARSQDSTPTVFYSFKSDLNYQKTLNNLKMSTINKKDKKSMIPQVNLILTKRLGNSVVHSLAVELINQTQNTFFYLVLLQDSDR